MVLKYSVGVDVSCKSLKCCISTIDKEQKVKVKSSTTVSNNLSGFKNLIGWIKKHYNDPEVPLMVCMEATGVYYEQCAYYLHNKGFKVVVVLPNKSKKYFQALGLKSKNDKIDAKGLAQMCAEQHLKIWEPMDDFYYVLRHLTRHHQSLQEQKSALNNQLHAIQHSAYQSKTILRQMNQTLALFDKQIKQIEKAIKEHITSNPEAKAKFDNVCAIKGLGLISVATVVAETNGFILFENYKQVVSYAGYDVVENQSGNHIGKTSISKKGNPRIRRILYMPALVVKTCQEPAFINLYNRTFERHGIKMKSYVAIQKKLLVMIYYLWKKNEKYNPNYGMNIQEKELVLPSLLAFEKGKNEVASL
jgi:transposase